MNSLDGTSFVVVDLETTGLFPHRHDRIIELAALRVDRFGQVRQELHTLINPQRDVGPTHVHGLTARDLEAAPTFEEIAGDVVEILRDGVFVAHNAPFDMDFLYASFRSIGHALPPIARLCTLRLTSRLFPGVPNLSLEACCCHLRVELEKLHCAYDDAQATTRLLALCLDELLRQKASDVFETPEPQAVARNHSWPLLPCSGKRLTRALASARPRNDAAYLAKLVHMLPGDDLSDPNVTHYISYLDRAIEDRFIDQHEALALYELAAELGMSREAVTKTHHAYLQNLVRCAKGDGVVTDLEKRDLVDVAHILSISAQELEALLESTEATAASTADSPILTPNENLVGKSICFTGQLQCLIEGQLATRSYAEEVATNAGLRIQKGVTKKLDILVTADPYSMSGKAKKARQYGTRILAEPVFWRLMGVEFSEDCCKS